MISSFLPWIFPSYVVPFQSKEVGRFLAHGRQYRRIGLVYFVILLRAKQVQIERDSFLFYGMPDSCIVFECSNKSDSEYGRALHIIPFCDDHRPE